MDCAKPISSLTVSSASLESIVKIFSALMNKIDVVLTF